MRALFSQPRPDASGPALPSLSPQTGVRPHGTGAESDAAAPAANRPRHDGGDEAGHTGDGAELARDGLDGGRFRTASPSQPTGIALDGLPPAPPAGADTPCSRIDGDAMLPMQRTLKAISGKWKLEVLCALVDGPKRFNELRREVAGVTQHMLAAQLRDLEAAGILERRAYAEMPPRVEYEMTEAGRALRPVAEALIAWGRTHGGDRGAA